MTASSISFAVIIPIFNRPWLLSASLTSACQQTYRPSQILVVDDFSDECYLAEFARIIDSHRAVLPVKYIRLASNMGPATARNSALEHLDSSVTHVSFLDSDDVWHPDKLLAVASVYAAFGSDIVLHSYSTQAAFGSLSINTLADLTATAKRVSLFASLMSNPCQTSCLAMARSANLPFPSRQRYCEDYCLILVALISRRSVFKIDAPLTILGRAQHSSGGLCEDIIRMRIGELSAYWQCACHSGVLFIFPFLLILSLFKALFLFCRLFVGRLLGLLSCFFA
jgi:glycosyltransferase involved in cell wall biosynthesis